MRQVPLHGHTVGRGKGERGQAHTGRRVRTALGPQVMIVVRRPALGLVQCMSHVPLHAGQRSVILGASACSEAPAPARPQSPRACAAPKLVPSPPDSH